jgi:Mg2+/Co2+ transporter CorB
MARVMVSMIHVSHYFFMISTAEQSLNRTRPGQCRGSGSFRAAAMVTVIRPPASEIPVDVEVTGSP